VARERRADRVQQLDVLDVQHLAARTGQVEQRRRCPGRGRHRELHDAVPPAIQHGADVVGVHGGGRRDGHRLREVDRLEHVADHPHPHVARVPTAVHRHQLAALLGPDRLGPRAARGAHPDHRPPHPVSARFLHVAPSVSAAVG
jgi:hypothetical protein